jgi:hypothetical protein
MVAAAVAGSAVVGGYLSSSAAKSAANTQADAAESAAQAQLQQFNTINSQQAPYRESGYSALNQLKNYFGIATPAPVQSRENFDAEAYLAANPDLQINSPNYYAKDPYKHWLESKGNRAFTGTSDYNSQLEASKAGANTPGFGMFNHQFDANDLKANLAPNYEFMLKQGQGQVGSTLNSTAGLLSGNAQQGLNTFTQNYAKNAYQDAFNNYTTNQNNIYNRLAGLAGIGQTSLQQSSAAGQNATNAASNYLTSGAAAQAAGTVGAANAYSNAANSVGNYYMLNSILK